MNKLQQKGPKLKVGDIIRVLDDDNEGHIAVCIQNDGHEEWPYCCMVIDDKEQERDEYWPIKYERICNAVQMVGMIEESASLLKAVRKLINLKK